ncbi:hypothetical protein AnigIFM63604_011849 [Aspergillus niger]|uniref:Uncharacterized protein n=1 Tax=Aspergillus niger TaxID=5061 RepID=A0A9W6A5Q3_ASPNG|nr:hypothetical protein AnigIFM63326_010627 [Aspergillus niger]GLA54313.1 hypothetical protein AnigIFM63604_011849 [Aspergillus niger]
MELIIDYEQEALRLRDEPLAGHGQSGTLGWHLDRHIWIYSGTVCEAQLVLDIASTHENK